MCQVYRINENNFIYANFCVSIKINGDTFMLYGITDWVKASENRCQMLNSLNKIITNVVYIIYPVLIIYLIIIRDKGVFDAVWIPAVSFVIVTLLRKKINAPRPYQVYGIAPIIPKDTLGNSFPSRHAFSIFIIAMVAMYIDVTLGIFMIVMGIVLCLVRVIGGVHFIKDVICGAFMGIVAGLFILF